MLFSSISAKTSTIGVSLVNIFRMTAAVIAIARDENRYLRDWVEHHKMLGIQRIFLIDNNRVCGECFEDVIGDYIESGYVVVYNRRGIASDRVLGLGLQELSVSEVFEFNKSEFDWILSIDIDEYLCLDDCFEKNVDSFLSQDKFVGADVIMLKWAVMDDNDLVHDDGRPCMERFTRECKGYKGRGYNCKCFYRTSGLSHVRFIPGTHNIVGDYRRVSSDGSDLIDVNSRLHGILTDEGAVIRHFMLMTIDEFVRRRLSLEVKWGNIETKVERVQQFFTVNEKTDEKFKIFDESVKKFTEAFNVKKEYTLGGCNVGNTISIQTLDYGELLGMYQRGAIEGFDYVSLNVHDRIDEMDLGDSEVCAFMQNEINAAPLSKSLPFSVKDDILPYLSEDYAGIARIYSDSLVLMKPFSFILPKELFEIWISFLYVTYNRIKFFKPDICKKDEDAILLLLSDVFVLGFKRRKLLKA